MHRKIYLASSWRNMQQPAFVESLRAKGHEVYDFKNPSGRTGFSWREVDPDWKNWTPEQYLVAMRHPISEAGFQSDWQAMKWADTGVLLLPSGRSAHIEAGYFVGARKPLHIVIGPELGEAELMYKMTPHIHTSLDGLLSSLAKPRYSTDG